MRKNSKRGITVTSIVVYVILFFMFTTLTTVLSSRFNQNLFNDRGTAINITAINKLEYNLLDSADESYSVKGTVNDNATILTFSNNDEYIFNNETHKIYKNGGELVDFLKDFDIRAIDDYLKINVTLNKYTNKITREIIVNVPVTNEYVLDDRVIHLDAIDNVGSSEQDSKAMIWKDLSGNNFNAKFSYALTNEVITDNWVEDGLLFDIVGSDGKTKHLISDFNKLAYESMTFEVNIKPISELNSSESFNILTLYNTQDGSLNLTSMYTNHRVFMYGSGSNTMFTGFSPLISKDNTYTFTFVQEDLTTRALYMNGNLVKRHTGLSLTEIVFNRIYTRNLKEGSYILHSIRIYDRALTEEEVVNNSQVDKLRFGM